MTDEANVGTDDVYPSSGLLTTNIPYTTLQVAGPTLAGRISAVVGVVRNLSIAVAAGAEFIEQAVNVPNVVDTVAIAAALIAHTLVAGIDAYRKADQ